MSRKALSAWEFLAGATFGAAASVDIATGSANPEGSVTAPAGSLYLRTSAGAGTTLYIKESGSGNTGWIPYSSTFSIGGPILDPTGARDIMVWRAPFACTVTNVRAHRKGGTGASVNARRNQSGTNHLSSSLSVSSADTWMDGGSVQDAAYAAGDDLELRLISITGAVTEITIQVDFIRKP
jgi:hypothetical protein